MVQELPLVVGNFRRRRRINEFFSLVSGMSYFVGAMALVGIVYKTAISQNLNRQQRDGGGGFSASAISKKGPRQGKKIDGMDDWIDMEENDDDE